MSAPRVLLVLALAATVPLAGCFGAEEVVNERKVTASGGKVSPGWAYDGAGVEAASASLSANFLNDQNTGEAIVTFSYAGSAWEVIFNQFAGSKDFMDGGVAFDLTEHGDTGVADTSIPKILALVAAWGTASVSRDGVPLVGAAGAEWAAHLMVSDTTVRGADGKILKSDGATPYDPASAGDATRVEGDRQAFLKLVHPDGESAARGSTAFDQSVEFAGAESTQTVAIPTELGAADMTILVNGTAGANPLAAGEFSARVIDEAGTELAAMQEAQVLPNAEPSLTFTVPGALIMGPVVVEITGAGAFTAVVTTTVAYDDHPLLVLTWDDLVVE